MMTSGVLGMKKKKEREREKREREIHHGRLNSEHKGNDQMAREQ